MNSTIFLNREGCEHPQPVEEGVTVTAGVYPARALYKFHRAGHVKRDGSKGDIMEGHNLELRREAGGLRYYLDGEGIHAGDFLEMRLDDGSWETGRFEWDFRAGTLPFFYVDEDQAIELTDSARFRWIRRAVIGSISGIRRYRNDNAAYGVRP